MAKKDRYKAGREKKGLNIKFDSTHIEFFQTVSAEHESRLTDYYVKNRFLQSAKNFESKKAFFIGRTGLGKTAILESIKRSTDPNSQLLVNPEDFAFTIMEKSELLKELSQNKVNLDLFYKTLWKYILITEILKKKFGSERKAWLTRQIQSVFNKPAKKAYEFLLRNEELGEGLTFSERITAIVKKMEHSVTVAFEKNGLKLSYGGKLTPDEKTIVQDALREFELSDLNYFISIMDTEVLPGQHYVILVDDLDKNWIQNSVGINFTRCLFETVFELNNTRSVKVVVSLRTNLFDQLKFHQTEKYLSHIEKVHWSDDELRAIIENRFKSIFPIDSKDVWNYIFPKEITLDGGKSLPFFDYLKSRTNRRPRDILLFISFMLKLSIGRNSVKLEAIGQAEKDYSIDRLKALFEEWSNPYCGLEFLQDYFLNRCYKFTKSEFFKILDDITTDTLIKFSNASSADTKWLIDGEFISLNALDYKKLFQLLYRIGLIGWKPFPDSKVQYSFQYDREEVREQITEDAKFYINPSYHRALHVFYQRPN